MYLPTLPTYLPTYLPVGFSQRGSCTHWRREVRIRRRKGKRRKTEGKRTRGRIKGAKNKSQKEEDAVCLNTRLAFNLQEKLKKALEGAKIHM